MWNKKTKIIRTDWKLLSLTGIEAQLRGAAGSSVWPLTSVQWERGKYKCLVFEQVLGLGLKEEEQQMYKIIQLLQPARRVYDTYDGPLSGLLTNWNNMSDWQLYYTYCTDCWLETGGETLCIPFILYSSWSHLLPCFLCSLVSCLSSCLFRQGGWGQQQRRIKALSLNAKQRQYFFRLRFGTLPPPAVSHTQQVSTPSLARWPQTTQPRWVRRQGKRGLLPWKPESTVKRGK